MNSFSRITASGFARRALAALIAAAFCVPAAFADTAKAADAAQGGARVADARQLLVTMRYAEILKQGLSLVFSQPMPGSEALSDEHNGVMKRLFDSMPAGPFLDGASKRLAQSATQAEIDEALAYFRGAAGQTELACVRDTLGTPTTLDCIRERGGEAHLQAHRAFAETSIENKLGEIMAGDSGDADFAASAKLALEQDPALAKELDAYCGSHPGGLCDVLKPAQAAP
ncbi:hypothetical protein GLA29479_1636 [Lysobacter antibioticus]|uniref:hypothetical protein n=1 Tax=Lysobacter antibioticus TaxID=84531 RepID=UPI0007173993|nr:hypothetical protein [Lysobacter antibioticus]ALN62510.1 hypothetical protein GLA29479_1636 [Lysobacter antibioticus]